MEKSDESKIACAVCGLRAHFLSPNHIRTHGITNTQYREQYPDAPLTSPWWKWQASERAKINNEARKGVPRSDDVKRKVSATKKQKFASGETKPHFLGKKHSAESKELMSIRAKATFENGRVHHMQGNHHSDDTKSKISAALEGRVSTPEALAKRTATIAVKKSSGWVHHNTLYMEQGTRYLANDPEWLVYQHYTLQRSFQEIAADINVDPTTLHRRFQQYELGQPKRYPKTKNERELASFIESLGVAVETNTRKVIPPLEIDLWLPELSIAIEHCGLFWHSTRFKDPDYHTQKLKLCQERGVRLITLFEDEWEFGSDIVRQKLKAILGKSDSAVTYARKCTIDLNVSLAERKVFFDTHHIQGDGPGSIAVGLRHSGNLVAVGLFIIRGEVAVLNRYATSARVPGGLSKIIKAFKHAHSNILKLESFADLRWSEGNLYESTGWKHEYTIPPDYYWVKGLQREHKFGFRHKHLPAKLATYDPKMTEVENCMANGWLQIYDCGKQKWTLEL